MRSCPFNQNVIIRIMAKHNKNVIKCYMDISFGDEKSYDELNESYNRAELFLKENGKSYGIVKNTLEECNDEEKNMLLDLYNSNPKWTQKGNIVVNKPKSLILGRIIIELYNKKCPKTCENFRALCTGEKGVCKGNSKYKLYYKGSTFHRYVKNFCLQGGDITKGDGSGGESIYGKKFKDEKNGLKLKHDKFGLLSMANSGSNSNNSQFFFTLSSKLLQLDKRHVVFGEVTSGIEILEHINNTNDLETTLNKSNIIRIIDCGEIK